MKDDAGSGSRDPLFAKTAQVAAAIDDPCDEGGFDQFCRDRHGTLCRFHEQFCKAPDYPCIDHLRHFLAVDFLEQIAERRDREAAIRAAPPANDALPLRR